MIRLREVKLPLSHKKEDLYRKAATLLHIGKNQILSVKIVKKSLDARQKPTLFYRYTLDVEVQGERKITERAKKDAKISRYVDLAQDVPYVFPTPGDKTLTHRPVMIGAGPAGLFCAYMLALHGYQPLLLERGKQADLRKQDVEHFWESGVLDPSSNVQFGEGGAGAFSDGKLGTLVTDKAGRNREVLRIFAAAGAPEEILTDAHPHIGTDKLLPVVMNLRKQIVDMGGEVRFECQVTDFVIHKGQIAGVIINHQEEIPAETVVLAVGHSARDTFSMLLEKQVPMQAKAFAVGLRMEHPRAFIDEMQYGRADLGLPAATYKLTAQTGERGVYTFCMCPGGYVVNSSSEPGRLAVNGMSYSGRSGKNSNGALVAAVTPEDFIRWSRNENGGFHRQDDDIFAESLKVFREAAIGETTGEVNPMIGVAFQRLLEERAFILAQGKVPAETFGNFRQAVCGTAPAPSALPERYPDFAPAIKGQWAEAPVHDILPDALNRALVAGMEDFGKKLPGFADSGVWLSGVESRTSSPVRILRDETGQSAIRGLYPCGEGAGYAGGITSAAMDGLYIAEQIGRVCHP